jgi:hypothetical protein
MSTSEVVLKVGGVVATFLAKRWKALVNPDAAIRKTELEVEEKEEKVRQEAVATALKQVEAVRAAGEAKVDLEKKELVNIHARMQLYRDMGVAEEKIRQELMPLIRQQVDPLAVLAKLRDKGKLRSPELLPDIRPERVDEEEEEEE